MTFNSADRYDPVPEGVLHILTDQPFLKGYAKELGATIESVEITADDGTTTFIYSSYCPVKLIVAPRTTVAP